MNSAVLLETSKQNLCDRRFKRHRRYARDGLFARLKEAAAWDTTTCSSVSRVQRKPGALTAVTTKLGFKNIPQYYTKAFSVVLCVFYTVNGVFNLKMHQNAFSSKAQPGTAGKLTALAENDPLAQLRGGERGRK